MVSLCEIVESRYHQSMISDSELLQILKASKTCAVVGLSDKEHRSSYGVAEYLTKYYDIIGVNPALSRWKDYPCYPSLLDIPKGTKVDIVDVFRRSEFVPEIVDQAIQLSPKLVWLQQGIVHEEAAQKARQAGIIVVMDACLAVVHSRLGR